MISALLSPSVAAPGNGRSMHLHEAQPARVRGDDSA